MSAYQAYLNGHAEATAAAKHEIDEARSEIGRHHDLIRDLRGHLEWALGVIPVLPPRGPDERRYIEAREFLHRDVG